MLLDRKRFASQPKWLPKWMKFIGVCHVKGKFAQMFIGRTWTSSALSIHLIPWSLIPLSAIATATYTHFIRGAISPIHVQVICHFHWLIDCWRAKPNPNPIPNQIQGTVKHWNPPWTQLNWIQLNSSQCKSIKCRLQTSVSSLMS